MSIHPTAVVDASATVAEGVEIGPGAVVGPDVVLGEGVVLGPHAVVLGHTSIGAGSRLHSGAVVGEPPQDLSYKGEATKVVIGEGCTLREHATVTTGTARGRGTTTLGNGCYMMAGSHVGHDCTLGDGVILSNAVLLAGHSQLGDYVLIGGGAAIVQRVRIGSYAFISGLSGVTRDVIPYGYVIGHRGRLDSLNLVGLKRRGLKREEIARLKRAYEMLFAEEGLFADRLAAVRDAHGEDPNVQLILDFVDAAPSRPLLQPLPAHLRGGDPTTQLEVGR